MEMPRNFESEIVKRKRKSEMEKKDRAGGKEGILHRIESFIKERKFLPLYPDEGD